MRVDNYFSSVLILLSTPFSISFTPSQSTILKCIDNISLPRYTGHRKFASVATQEECVMAPNPTIHSNFNTKIQIPQHNHQFSEGYPSPLHFIHVEPLLKDEEVQECLKLAISYGSAGNWDQPDLERHTNYATCDFAVEDAPVLENYLEQIKFKDRLWNRLTDNFNIPSDHLFGFLDLFCVSYVAADDDDSSEDTMDHLEAHRDGSIVSFSVLLTPPSQFRGGGTFFEALRHVEPDDGVLRSDGVLRPKRAGDVVMHSGKLLHGAEKVTQGQRIVLVGFVDMAGPKPGVLAKASTNWGRLDVAEQRYERQLLKTKHQQYYKRSPKSRKFISPKSSCLTKIIPVSDSARMRAEPTFQRERRLAIEDELLRSALFDGTSNELEQNINGFEGIEGLEGIEELPEDFDFEDFTII